MSSFENSPAVIIDKRTGTEESPFVPIDESLVINTDGKVILSEIPVKFNRVEITNDPLWCEIDEGLPNDFQYKVDYQNKIVTFNIVNVGKQLNFRYMGMGNHYYSAKSIYTATNNGKVTETLYDVIEQGQTAIEGLKEVNQTLEKAETVITNAEAATANANNSALTANEKALLAAQKAALAEDKANQTQSAIDNVDLKINEVNTKLLEIDTKSTEIDATLQNATNKITEIETVKQDVNSTIERANTAIANTETATTNANSQANYAQQQGDEIELVINNFRYAGDYNNTVQYVRYNLVRYNGSTYICIKDSLGNAVGNTSFWQLLAIKGEDGQGSVNSVNGQGGDVLLDAHDVGAIENDGNVPLIGAGSLAARPSTTSDGHLYISWDDNKIYRFDQTSGTWIMIGGSVNVDWKDITGKPLSFLTKSEQTKFSSIHEGAEVNQNAFSSVKIADKILTSSQKTDQLEIVAGNNVEILADETTKKITFGVSEANLTEIAHYEYILEATEDSQSVFTIPLETFSDKDMINLFINRTPLMTDDYTISGKTITLLNDVVNIGESLYVVIVKNIKQIEQETLDGSFITDNSLSKDKMTQDIKNSLVRADSSVPSSDIGITVAGFNELGQVLDKHGNVVEGAVKSVNGHTGEVVINVPTKTSELINDSDFESKSESQTKVNQSLYDAKTYTDTKFSNIVIPVTSVNGNTGDVSIDVQTPATQALQDAKTYIDAELAPLGDLATLTTEDKSTIVNALNEVNAKPSGGGGSDAWELIATHDLSPTAPLFTLYQSFTEFKRLKFILKSLAVHSSHVGTVALGMLSMSFTDLSFGGYVSAGYRNLMMATSSSALINPLYSTTRRTLFPLLSGNIPATTSYPHLETSGTIELNKSWWKSNQNYGFMPRRLWVDTELRVKDPNSSTMNRFIERASWEFPVDLNNVYPARVGITTDRPQGFTTGTIEIWGVKGDANDV